jgi:uncharacterized protein YegP (UPF0339 family)
MKLRMKKEFYQRPDGKWDWRVFASNGNIVATSGGQGYNRRALAEKSFNSIVSAFREGRIG